MPQPVDVGSVLGGRYKVTAQVLASAEQDLVLDGIDQVLNRPVSILVAAPAHAGQLSSSARELATGERAGSMQVLDLGASEGETYLVTNRAAAADLLDLVVASDAPYIEPFFTDTLGSEIFGMSRSSEPETYDDDTEYNEALYEDEQRRPRLNLPKRRLPRFGQKGGATAVGAAAADETADSGAGAAGQAAQAGPAGQAGQAAGSAPAKAAPSGTGSRTAPAASGPSRPSDAGVSRLSGAGASARGTSGSAAAPSAPAVPPPPSGSPHTGGPAGTGGNTGQKPKVSLWSEEDFDETADAGGPADAGHTTALPTAGGSRPDRGSIRTPSTFPASAVAAGSYDEPDYDTEEDVQPKRRSSRVLVFALVGIIVVVALVVGITQLIGNSPRPVAGPATSAAASQAPSQSGAASTGPGNTAPAKPAASPSPVRVTRVVPGNQDLDAVNDGALPKTIDGNPASFWASYVYASDAFGGLAQNLALVVQLDQESSINSVQVTQLNGSGGNFSVLLNDSPSLNGATQVGQGSFTAPTVTVPVPQTNGAAPTAKYVIVNFTQLPRLSNNNGPFPFGLQIAEIKVS